MDLQNSHRRHGSAIFAENRPGVVLTTNGQITAVRVFLRVHRILREPTRHPLAKRKKTAEVSPEEKLPLERRRPDSNRGNNGFAIRRLRPLGYGANVETDIIGVMRATGLSPFIGCRENRLHRKTVELRLNRRSATLPTTPLVMRFVRHLTRVRTGLNARNQDRLCQDLTIGLTGQTFGCMLVIGLACYHSFVRQSCGTDESLHSPLSHHFLQRILAST